MDLQKKRDSLHKLIVDLDLAEAFLEEHYVETTFCPNAWQEYKYQKPVPDKMRNALNETSR